MIEQIPHPEELLPWFVNGTLSAEEQKQVELHLDACADCRAEIDQLRAVRDIVKKSTEVVPSEFAWQRVRRDLRKAGRHPSAARRWWVPSAAAAAVVVIAIQGIVLFNVFQKDGYQLAGQSIEGTVLQVKFNPGITEEELRTTLQSVNGEIVSGPGVSGVYRIRLIDDDAKSMQERIDSLRARRQVIEYLEQD